MFRHLGRDVRRPTAATAADTRRRRWRRWRRRQQQLQRTQPGHATPRRSRTRARPPASPRPSPSSRDVQRDRTSPPATAPPSTAVAAAAPAAPSTPAAGQHGHGGVPETERGPTPSPTAEHVVSVHSGARVVNDGHAGPDRTSSRRTVIRRVIFQTRVHSNPRGTRRVPLIGGKQ